MIDEFLAQGLSDVEEAVRKAAAVEIMPRFRQLAEHEVDEKNGPHDLVTVADRKAEEHLTASLRRLLPGSAVVGRRPCTPTPPSTTPCAATPRCGSSTRSTAPASSSAGTRLLHARGAGRAR